MVQICARRARARSSLDQAPTDRQAVALDSMRQVIDTMPSKRKPPPCASAAREAALMKRRVAATTSTSTARDSAFGGQHSDDSQRDRADHSGAEDILDDSGGSGHASCSSTSRHPRRGPRHVHGLEALEMVAAGLHGVLGAV
ncbi:hypothetical protein OAO87_02815 [bacterium]|nr:hypothetical protein [bacterium]